MTNLTAGTYTLCIVGTDGTLDYEEQCFEVVITEPEELAVASKTSLDGKVVELELQGSELYYIELNGELIQTEASQFTLNLKVGSNSLKIYTNIPCQGTYEEQFFYSEEPVAYPNPFTDFVKINFGTTVEEITISIFSSHGQLIRNEKHQVNGVELELDLSTLPTGSYFIKFEGSTISGTANIVKR